MSTQLLQLHTIDTASLRMRYLQAGTGEPLLFIHGFPETSHEWRHQIAHFAADYAVFAPDTRGYGGTDKPGARVTRAMLAADIIDFMDALGINRASVVGHDWGGIIAFKLAIDWPHRVQRLALMDTLCTVWHPMGVHGYWFKAAPLPEQFFAEYHREFIEAVITGRPSRELPGPPASPWAGISAPSDWADSDTLAHYAAAFADPDSHGHAISYYRDALPFHIVHAAPERRHGERYEFLDAHAVGEMWRHPDGLLKHPLHAHFLDYGPEDRHKRFEAPTLWLMSARAVPPRSADGLPSGTPFLDQFARYFPNLRAAAIDGGHFFPEENPDATNAALAAFLSTT